MVGRQERSFFCGAVGGFFEQIKYALARRPEHDALSVGRPHGCRIRSRIGGESGEDPSLQLDEPDIARIPFGRPRDRETTRVGCDLHTGCVRFIRSAKQGASRTNTKWHARARLHGRAFQFRMTVMGGIPASPVRVVIKNRCPSDETAYWCGCMPCMKLHTCAVKRETGVPDSIA